MPFGTPEIFDEESDTWSNYVERLNFYFEANEIVDNVRKRAILFSQVGKSTFDIIKKVVFPANLHDKTYDEICEILKKYFQPKINELCARQIFYSRNQVEGECYADFVKELKGLADPCNFETPGTVQFPLDIMLRDRFILGICDEKLKQELIIKEGISFEQAFKIAVTKEQTQKQLNDISKEKKENVINKVSQNFRKKKNEKNNDNDGIIKDKVICYRCNGANHNSSNCYFKNETCRFCSKVGHIERACIKKKKMKETNCVSDFSEEKLTAHNRMYDIFRVETDSNKIMVDVEVNERVVRFEVDSGASKTIINENEWRKMFPRPKMVKTSTILQDYSGRQLDILGNIFVSVKLNDKAAHVSVIVAPRNFQNILGRDWFSVLGIQIHGISQIINNGIEGICKSYEEIFSENLNEYKGPKVSVLLKPDAKPKFCKARTVPFALRTRVEEELLKLQKQGILTPIEFSQWATPVVIVHKEKGKIRLCGDYRHTINSQCLTNEYPLPTIKEMRNVLAGGNFFSKLDLQQAYQQLLLEDETAMRLTINTCKGLFRVNRLPFGISASPGIFQRIMDLTLQNIPGVKAYLDDIIIVGSSEKEHLDRLKMVFERLLSSGLKVKREKCEFFKSSIDYLGYTFDKEGMTPTKEKTKAILDAPDPKSKEELQSFLGMLSFYDCFLKDRATIAQPLYELLKKKVSFKWTDEHRMVFKKLKFLIGSRTVLTYYMENRELFLACDASSVGIGAVLSHRIGGKERPIAFASRTLSVAEKNYAQIDKEGLAVVFGVKYFHQYLAGRSFTIYTDHKPLISIFCADKNIPAMSSPRLIRWALILSMYNYEIRHRPGKFNANADVLSRLPLKVNISTPDPQEVLLIEEMDTPALQAKDIEKATLNDETLEKVKRYLLQGFPSYNLIRPDIMPFVKRKKDLSLHKGCILLGSRVVIPKVLQAAVLKMLHANHRGIVQMKSVARSYVYWLNLDKDIERFVNVCDKCQQTRNLPPRSKSQTWNNVNNSPWKRLHMDLAGPFKSQYFFLVVDSYSKWLEVRHISKITSSLIIDELRTMFATHGIPEELVSDNGTQFNSNVMRTFCAKNGIKLTNVPPGHPSSNGQIERYVQEMKKKLSLLDEGSWKTKLARFLFSQHNTVTSTGKTPAQLLMNRELRTHICNLVPKDGFSGNDFTTDNQTRQFKANEPVYYKNLGAGPKWFKGSIVFRRGPVSYKIMNGEGKEINRHVDHIRHRMLENDGGRCKKTQDKDWSSDFDSSTSLTPLTDSYMTRSSDGSTKDNTDSTPSEFLERTPISNSETSSSSEVSSEDNTDLTEITDDTSSDSTKSPDRDRPSRDKKLPAKFQDFVLS